MLKIGITGGIGSGKSVVSRLFAQLGIPVFDSDIEARRLIDTDPAIKAQLNAAFGQVYLPGDRGLDRKKVGALVFKDAKALETLNAITHPPVIAAAKKWIADQAGIFERQKSRQQQNIGHTARLPYPSFLYVIKEAALLFESGTDKSLDFIVGIYADEATRISRIMQRDQLSEADARNRIQKQMDEDLKMGRCAAVIINDGRHLLWPQVLYWHQQFQARVLR